MDATDTISSPLRRLQRLARLRAKQEHCELCGSAIAAQHQHLLELAARRLVCSCDACAILFAPAQAARYRRIPRRVQALDLQISEATWESLQVPINLAFFYHDSKAGRVVVMYPSPAGATESLLTIESWIELTEASAALRSMQSDVEALLVNRIGNRRDALLVPIDACYQLVGVIRSHWRGLSGGKEVWEQIDRLFDQLRRAAGQGRGDA